MNLVSRLRIGSVILLHTQALSIDKQLNFISICINCKVEILAWSAGPMVRQTSYALLNTIPFNVLRLFLYADMHHWFIFLEYTASQICIRLRLKVYIEQALCPSLGWPPLTLPKIVNDAPIGRTNDLVQIHLIIVRT